MLKKVVLAFALLALFASTSQADGGVLTFTREGEPGKPIPDAGYFWGTSTRTKASIQLPVSSPTDATESWHETSVFVFDSIALMYADSSPIRIVTDLNGDRQCQPDEITFLDTFPGQIPWRLALGGAEKILNATVSFDVGYGYCSANMLAIDGHYEGEIELAGKRYPARLDYSDPFSQPLGLVSLDVQGDGKFTSNEDIWFVADFGLEFDGTFYDSSMVVTDETAEITLFERTENIGTFSIKGEGFRHARVELTRENARVAPMRLSYREDGLYRLPAGEYNVRTCSLEDQSDPPATFFFAAMHADCPQFSVVSDSTTELALGGPLEESIEVTAKPLAGCVFLDHKGLKNSTGFKYEDSRSDRYSNPPKFEIHNSRGNRIAQGAFQYG